MDERKRGKPQPTSYKAVPVSRREKPRKVLTIEARTEHFLHCAVCVSDDPAVSCNQSLEEEAERREAAFPPSQTHTASETQSSAASSCLIRLSFSSSMILCQGRNQNSCAFPGSNFVLRQEDSSSCRHSRRSRKPLTGDKTWNFSEASKCDGRGVFVSAALYETERETHEKTHGWDKNDKAVCTDSICIRVYDKNKRADVHSTGSAAF